MGKRRVTPRKMSGGEARRTDGDQRYWQVFQTRINVIASFFEVIDGERRHSVANGGAFVSESFQSIGIAYGDPGRKI